MPLDPANPANVEIQRIRNLKQVSVCIFRAGAALSNGGRLADQISSPPKDFKQERIERKTRWNALPHPEPKPAE